MHPQLRELWETELKHESRLDVWKPRSVGSFKFVPLVISAENLIAELDVLLLRQEEPGKILTHGGDIDNRLKTLFDALPMPKDASEIPPGDKPGANEAPFYCLLEDDALVKRVAIDTDCLLVSQGDQSDVQLLVSTRVFATEVYIELTGRRLVQPW